MGIKVTKVIGRAGMRFIYLVFDNSTVPATVMGMPDPTVAFLGLDDARDFGSQFIVNYPKESSRGGAPSSIGGAIGPTGPVQLAPGESPPPPLNYMEVPVGETAFIFAVVRIAVELDATEAGHGGIATVGRLELRFEPRAGTDPGHREPLGAKLRTAAFPRAVATAFFARVLCVFTRVYDTNVLTSTAAAAALGGAAAAAGRRRRTVWILRGAPGEA